MQNCNKAIIIGRLGRDPELKKIGNGTLCELRVATSEKYSTKDGQQKESVEWHTVSVWDGQGELAARHLKKGSAVFVEGKIETRMYEKNGEKRYSTSIRASSVTYLERESNEAPRAPAKTGSTHTTVNAPIGDEEVPF